MKLLIFITNTLFLILNRNRHNKFFSSSAKLGNKQESILLNTIKANQETDLGKKYRFSTIKSISDFQQLIPLSTYKDYQPYIQRIMDGRKNAVTSDEVTNLVPTSGSSSVVKYIPYTKSLLREFNSAVSIWMYNLYISFPGLLFGQQFWIITPQTKLSKTRSSVPIGFAADSSYLSKIGRYLLKHVMVLPDKLGNVINETNYFYLISYYLIGCSNIRLISVWNPSMLISITNFIEYNISNLAEDIESGTIHLPRPEISKDIALVSQLPKIKSSQRAKTILELKRDNNFTISMFWPNLLLISCWTDAWASHYLPSIRKLFPGIPIQGKGLLATEAVVSIPVNNVERPLLAYNVHFYEFKSLKTGELALANELMRGEQYEVIITTRGGLYRYCLHDIIEVKGFERGIPMLAFIGKSDKTSDLTGEKLSEIHVSRILAELSTDLFSTQTHTFLGVAQHKETFSYVLYVEKNILKDASDLSQIVEVLDQKLSANYHYLHSRKMNQLAMPGIALISQKDVEKYLELKTSSTIRSTAKFSSLETDINLLNKLDTEIIWPLNEEATYHTT